MAEIKTDEKESRALDQDWTDDISCIFSSHATWQVMDIMWPISQSHFHVSCLCSLK